MAPSSSHFQCTARTTVYHCESESESDSERESESNAATMTQTLSWTRTTPSPDFGAMFRPETDPPNDVPRQLGDILWGV